MLHRMPSHIKTYDGSDDPEDHLKNFQSATKTERWAMPTWCHMFNSTLIGNARVWFDELPKETIDSYDDLKKAFLENYLQQKKCIKDPVEIHNIRQRDGESTKEFVWRYKIECRGVKGAPECMKISGFMHGITNPELIERLHDKISKSVDEMMRVTTAFLRGEIVASNREQKKPFSSWKQQEADQKQNFKKGGFWNQQRSERKQDRFSLLTRTPKEIFALEKGKFKAPPPMTTPIEKRNLEKFCEFHGKVGHNTDECMHPKKQIEEMLKAGKLSHLIKELKQNNRKEQPKMTKKGETFEKDKAEDEGTEGPMIIEAEIGGHCVHPTTPLIGFSGEIIWPIGQIQLLVKIGDEEHSASAWMNFMVIRSSSSYNGIIGRPGVKKLQAVHSSRNAKDPGRRRSNYLKDTTWTFFSWKPADKTGVPRHIAEHRLNVREGWSLVRQKKRGQATDRNQAIQEEVGKLVKADAYKGYHQIQMAKEDEEKTAFITNQGIFCYTKMPFGLRNAGETYQRLVDKEFHKQIGGNLEVYVDDLVIKSRTKDEIVRDIEETFKTLREINMKLNPKKFTFGVEEGMFLGFLAKSAEKSLPFFKTLKKCMKKSNFHWTTEAEEAFKQMKQLIAELPMLTASIEKEELIVYLAAAKETVSAVLMTERKAKQMPIYIVIRALRGLELNYTSMEKLVLALVHASKRLKRVSVKGQILADFIVESPEEDSPDTPMEEEEELPEPWILFTDGSSCTDGFGAGLILTNPEGMKFTYALRFRFDTTNNEAEYEALIAGLRIAKQMGVKNLQANVDSRLVANQMNRTYVAKEADMIRYLEKVKTLTGNFKAFTIKQTPRSKNKKADALSKIASTSFAHLKETLLTNMKKARAIKRKSWRFAVINEIIYKKSFIGPWLRFGLPREIISDNGKQFRDDIFKDWCEKLCIQQHFASVKHLRTNGLVERANRSLSEGIKARMEARSKNWMEELPHVLWAHRTMIKSSNEDTPFLLTYETEVVIPAEIGMSTIRTAEVDLVRNNEALEINLDLLEERREESVIREAKSKAKMEKYYNAKVRNISFKPGDLIYRNNNANRAEDIGKLGPKWEGPYEVTEALGKGAYKLRDRDRKQLPRTWKATSRSVMFTKCKQLTHADSAVG
ncbi:reverse transcriptase domain-containing protein [Tanacetum coccineum]